MRKIVQRLLSTSRLLGLAALSAIIMTIVVTLRHMLDTPQPLASILPGEAGIYHWRHSHLFYKTLGDEHAPPLVLLHSPTIGASSYEMRKIVGTLAQHYHVYALDLLGFGLSDRPRIDYTAETYITMCRDFLSEVVARPATIVASELSCNYAVILAQRSPELCTRLVLISPVWLFSREPAPNRWSGLLQEPNMKRILHPLLSTRLALRYELSHQHSPLQGQIAASDIDYLYAATHQFGAEHAPLARLAGKLAVNASAQFEQLQQPTLIIWGARALNDTQRIISGQQQLSALAEMALIQDAGLYVHEEYPSTVVANIVRWSKEHSAQKATKRSTTTKSTKLTEAEQQPATTTQVEVQEPLKKQHIPADVKAQDQESKSNANKAQATGKTDEHVIAYCVRCKKKTIMKDAQEVTMKNGSPAVRGKCSVCGAGQYRIGRL